MVIRLRLMCPPHEVVPPQGVQPSHEVLPTKSGKSTFTSWSWFRGRDKVAPQHSWVQPLTDPRIDLYPTKVAPQCGWAQPLAPKLDSLLGSMHCSPPQICASCEVGTPAPQGVQPSQEPVLEVSLLPNKIPPQASWVGPLIVSSESADENAPP